MMKNNRSILKTASAALAALCLGLMLSATGATITVGPSGCNYTTIQAAITAAAAGDTITVAAGTYAEALTVAKAVTLVGAGSAATIIQPTAGNNAIALTTSGSSGNVCALTLQDVGLTVSGAGKGINAGDLSYVSITLTNAVINYGLGSTGILLGTAAGSTTHNAVSVSNSRIECVPTGSESSYSRAIAWYNSSASTLDITDSTLTAEHYAIRLACPGLVANIHGSTLTGYAAFNLNSTDSTINIDECTLTGRTYWPSDGGGNDYGTLAMQDTAVRTTVNVTHSTIANDFVGVGATSYETLITSTATGGQPAGDRNNKVYLDSATVLTNANRTYAPSSVQLCGLGDHWYIDNVEQDNPLYPGQTILYVSSAIGNDANDGAMPTTAKKTVTAAITAAPAGYTIQVAPGAYAESLAVSKAVTLAGAGPAATIIQPAAGSHAITMATSGSVGNVLELKLKDIGLTVSGTGRGINIGDLTYTATVLENTTISFAETGRGIAFGSAGGGSHNAISLLNSRLECAAAGGSSQANRGISYFQSSSSTLDITDSTVTAGHYALTLNSPSLAVNIHGSTLTGYAALNLHNDGSTINVDSSTLTGRTFWNGPSDAYGAIAFDSAQNTRVNVTTSTIANEWSGAGATSWEALCVDNANLGNTMYLDGATVLDNNSRTYAPYDVLAFVATPGAVSDFKWYIDNVEQAVPVVPDVYVDGSIGSDSNGSTAPNDAKQTIQAAITAASAGNLVYVAAGTYTGDVVLNKTLTLTGSSTVIDGDVTFGAAITMTGITVASGHVCNVTVGGSIQAAINAAPTAGTVNVAAGTYRERVTLNKSITVTGDRGDVAVAGPGPNAPILDGDLDNNGSADMGDGFTIPRNTSLSGITVEGFIIRNFGNGNGGNGVGCGVISWENSSANVTIRDNRFTNLGYNGVYVGTDSEDNQSNWVVQRNVVVGAPYAGIELTDVKNCQVLDNEISGPTTVFDDPGDAGVGIEIAARARTSPFATTNVLVKGNTITGTFASGSRTGINLLARAYNANGTDARLSGITVVSNTVSGSGTRGIYVVAESRSGKPSRIDNLSIAYNTLTGNSAGVEVGGSFTAPNVNGTYDVATITIQNNSLSGNTSAGLSNLAAVTVPASSNWWGDATGPGPVGPGTGDAVSANVSFDPWYNTAEMDTRTFADVIAAIPQGATTTLLPEPSGSTVLVDLDSGTTASFTAALEEGIPAEGFTGMGDTVGGQGIAKSLSVTTVAANGAFVMVVAIHYTDAELAASGVSESDLRLYWWNPTPHEWQLAVAGNTRGTIQSMGNAAPPASPTVGDLGQYGVDTANNLIWAVVDHTSDFSGGEGPSEAWVDLAYTAASPDWRNTQFDNIQDAIDSCAAGATIHVAAGTYVGDVSLDRAITLTGSAAVIQGNVTVGATSTMTGITVASGYAYNVTAGGSIQAAIDAVPAGGTVNVAAGTYIESLTVSKAVNLVGAGPAATIIQPAAGSHAITMATSGSVGNVLELKLKDIGLTVSGTGRGINIGDLTYTATVLENTTITFAETGRGIALGSAGGGSHNAISLLNSRLECAAAGGSSGANRGISYFQSSSSTLDITDSTVTAGHYALTLNSPSLAVNIHGSTLTGYAALNLHNEGSTINVDSSTLTGRTFWSGPSDAYGAIAFDTAQNTRVNVTTSTIANEWSGAGATSWEALVVDNANLGNTLYLDSATVLDNNSRTYAPYDVLAFVGTPGAVSDFKWYINNVEQAVPVVPDLFVDGSIGSDSNGSTAPNDAKQTIQAAITAASAGNLVYVAAGTYTGDLILNKALTLTGNSTVIDGDVTFGAAITMTGITLASGHVCNVTAGGSIQAAIDAVPAGGTVNVAAGTYTENVTISKALSLIGADKATTIIDGGGNGVVVLVNNPGAGVSGVAVKNFTVRNSGAGLDTGAGIALAFAYGCTIENNILTGNTSAIALLSSSGNSVIDNTISGSARYGIVMSMHPADPTVWTALDDSPPYDSDNALSNTLHGNQISASGRDGIFVAFPNQRNVITDNTISGTIGTTEETGFEANGLYLWKSSLNTVTGNTITGTTNPEGVGNGIEMSGSGINTITGNTITGHYTALLARQLHEGDAASPPIHVDHSTVSGNDLSGNTIFISTDWHGLALGDAIGDPFEATPNWFGTAVEANIRAKIVSLDHVIYNPWYNTAAKTTKTYSVGAGLTYTTVQSAVTDASAGDTINVAAGTYTGDVVLNKALTLTGSSTVIDGDVTFGAAITMTGITVASGHVCNVTVGGSIQAAINAAPTAGTVNVAAGTYVESNIAITKTLTIQGGGATRDDVVIVPVAEDGNANSAFGTSAQNGLIVAAHNVTIAKLTINGQGNPALTAGKSNFRAAIVTADAGQAPAPPVTGGIWSNLHVDDVSVKNIYRRGISVTPAGCGGTLVEHSGVDNVVLNHGIYVMGQGLVISNTVNHAFQGIVMDPTAATPAGLVKVIGNTLTDIGNSIGCYSYPGGQPRAIQCNPTGPARAFEVTDNTISDNGVELNAGVVGVYTRLWTSDSVLSGNDITLSSGVSRADGSQAVGLLLGWSYTEGFAVTSNHVHSSKYGIGVMVFGSGSVAKPLVLDGNIITSTGSAALTTGDGTGVYVANQYLFAGDKSSSYVILRGNTISGFVRGLAAEKIVTSTELVTVTALLNSITGNTTGIDASTLSTTLNAESNWWGSAKGPTIAANPGGNGDAVSANVDFSPWLGDGTDTSTDVGFQPNLTPLYWTATGLEFSTQPGGSVTATALAPQPVVTVRNEIGGVASQLSGDVTLAIGTNPGGGALVGTKAVATDAGVATFTDLSIDKSGTGYTLEATFPGLPTATSSSFNILDSVTVFSFQ